MNNHKIWLSPPHMGGSELKYIHQAFAENWVAPLGPNVNLFEDLVEDFLGENSQITALSSGTAALHLALIILGVKAGDEVICQSMTFAASAFPIVYLGAKPVFVDSEEDTWNICPDRLMEAIEDRILKGKKPKAIIAVHLYGMPAKMDEILAISKKYDIPVLEDSAESFGSSYKNKKCGTFGEMALLSFNGNKIITTSGGGAIVCKTKAHKDKALFLSTQARELTTHYEHSEIGYNYRMSNITAGIGCGQMEVLEDRIFQRQENHLFYSEFFKDKPGINLHSEPNEDFKSNHWLSTITIDKEITGFSSHDLCKKFAEANIESRPLWKPMHMQPVFQDADFYGGDISENLFKNGLCLPSGSNLSDQDRALIKGVLESCFVTEKIK
ncbi:aminotransferase class V-fold PLP-dependent enzyme [Halpernia frigidisoli]|uniref:dTDP-4-amino-4,6-dideoxygalactose transaminase n=1 Tax=Halpernia frigidisoli TaxID=1125876 RepID=A0A1I3FC83_9FLAO|nr:aminotransferase class I/II-fold pyridoxal phosphate-dependent enzyme [Halpernia frigidisoli]SFI08833.1 dTDP-4-amino-4,6-dideoxygalactose transaminase [Halpernia frigidisoli]